MAHPPPAGTSRRPGAHRRAGSFGRLPVLTALLGAAAASLFAATAIATPAGASGSPPVVKAIEIDFHIALPKHTFGPGRYTFLTENKGHVTHAVERRAPTTSSAGVAGHKALGVNVGLKLGSPAKTAAQTSSGSRSTASTMAKSGGSSD